MSQENINLARALHTAFTAQNLEQAITLINDEFEWKVMPLGIVLNGCNGFRTGFKAFATPFPGAQVNYKNVIDNGDQVAVEYDFMGMHLGELVTPTGAIPPTGRPVTWAGIEVFRIRDGKIASLHTYFDSVTMLTQLGILPQPQPA